VLAAACSPPQAVAELHGASHTTELSVEIGLSPSPASPRSVLQQFYRARDLAACLQQQLDAAEAEKAALRAELERSAATCGALQDANCALQQQVHALQAMCASLASSRGSNHGVDSARQEHMGAGQQQPQAAQQGRASNSDSLDGCSEAAICPSWPPIERVTTVTWAPDTLDSNPASPAAAEQVNSCSSSSPW
jgi:hypothetical protein